ncbi:hypothetical protein BLA29_007039 [Euroglyphus maynei]|uniref:Uncharacterized protein n=1 Tax=Euroglyphus maynei TaxID=6958 RepID=A0A1Y3B618_EURMA|nr:hypothetical protein BLA29_007039 [Euroglyphus maynei]
MEHQMIKCFQFKTDHSMIKLNDNISDPDDDDSLVEIKILQDSDNRYSSITWPSADLLCRFILTNRMMFVGKTILELGSGTGICGIMAAKIGAKVILSDQTIDNSELILSNVDLNDVEARYIPLDWSKRTDLISDQIPNDLDYIIGSDLCYEDERQFEKLLFTIAFLFENNQQKTIPFYMAYHFRSSNYQIECLLRKFKLQCKLLFHSENLKIYLYEITLKNY